MIRRWFVLAMAVSCTAFANNLDLAISLGKPFTLSPKQIATYQPAKLSLEFLGVSNDSRCPKGLACLVAGNASLTIKVSIGQRQQSVTLNTQNDPRSQTVLGYRLKLVNLEPERGPQGETPKIYRATFTLQKP